MCNVSKKSEGKIKKKTTTKSSYLSKKLIEMYRKKSIRITIILCQSMRCFKKNKIKRFFIYYKKLKE